MAESPVEDPIVPQTLANTLPPGAATTLSVLESKFPPANHCNSADSSRSPSTGSVRSLHFVKVLEAYRSVLAGEGQRLAAADL